MGIRCSKAAGVSYLESFRSNAIACESLRTFLPLSSEISSVTIARNSRSALFATSGWGGTIGANRSISASPLEFAEPFSEHLKLVRLGRSEEQTHSHSQV